MTTLAYTASPLSTEWMPTRVDTKYDLLVQHKLHLALIGIESTVVIGPPGAGKTSAVTAAVNAHNAREFERLEQDDDAGPRVRVEWVRASNADGKKTGLIDVYACVVGRASTRMRQAFTTAELIEVLAQECQQRNIRALVIDEAQKVSPQNLDQIRQITDAAKAEGHPFGVMLIGTPELRRLVAQTGQLGQRYTGLVDIQPLPKHEMLETVPKLHPDLPRLRAELGEPAWRLFAEDFVRVSNGSLRRAGAIIANAHMLDAKKRRALMLDSLQICLDNIAPEV